MFLGRENLKKEIDKEENKYKNKGEETSKKQR